MDVRDYSQKVDQARDRYREAQEDLRASYEKNLDDMKETFDTRSEKQARNFNEHKLKLEEQNLVNNELYSQKTKEAITKKQNEFKERLKDNTVKFEQERNNAKLDFKDKLSNLSESYKKSTEENNRFNDQTKKIMGERYKAANERYKNEFNEQISNLEEKSKRLDNEGRDKDREERVSLAKDYSDKLENVRLSNNEQKFKEVSRLRGDIENLRTTFDRERAMQTDRQEERVAEMLKNKTKESDDVHHNFSNLQDDIRQKNLATQEREALKHKQESKQLEEKFNEDLRNIQRVHTQKVKGGTQADTLSDELRQTKTSYENRLDTARKELANTHQANTAKENLIDKNYREKLKDMKADHVDKLEKKEQAATDTLKKTVYELRDKNNSIVDRYKGEIASTRAEADSKFSAADEKNSARFKEQRIEFGKVVNTMNEKNMNTISSLKEDYSKDKSESIERSKKEFNDEKVSLKSEFNRQMGVKESLYENRLMEMEKKTNKIIENYENRIAQIARKADKEVEKIKLTEEERKTKEAQAQKIASDRMEKAHRTELLQLRDKYETMVARDRMQSEKLVNNIVQKYEDQLERERTESQKVMSVRLSEAQAQLERFYNSSEIEKENIRAQSEARIENMKLAMSAQERSKKA